MEINESDVLVDSTPRESIDSTALATLISRLLRNSIIVSNASSRLLVRQSFEVPRFVYWVSSRASVPVGTVFRGNVDCFGHRSCYDESKRYGDSVVRAYRDKHDLNVRVVRIFNTYGPRTRIDDERVIPRFAKQALQGEDLTIYGNGSQTRSFCYVSDLIDGLRAHLDADVQTPVIIGNPDERTILELAETLVNRTDSESEITFTERPPQDPDVRCPDLTKARAELGWEPEVPPDEGIDRLIEYFESKV